MGQISSFNRISAAETSSVKPPEPYTLDLRNSAILCCIYRHDKVSVTAIDYYIDFRKCGSGYYSQIRMQLKPFPTDFGSGNEGEILDFF